MIFGLPGSGKSTFATKLAQFLDLPIHYLDKHFYIENWVERDHEEFLDIQRSVVNQSKWIIDGNSMRSLEMRFQQADCAIYFRYPIVVSLWHLIKRVFHQNWTIPDLARGCNKSISFKLIRYLFRYHKRYGQKIDELRRKYPHVCFYVFRSEKDIETFLDTLNRHQSEMEKMEDTR